jgi:hypothetical protein
VKRFFASLNLVRWMLLGSAVLSVVLAFTGWRLHQRRVGLEEALEVQVPRLAQDIQVNSLRFSRLYEEAEGAGLTGQKDAQTYLRELAADPLVQMGGVEIDKLNPTMPSRGVVDIAYRILPQSRDRGFVRVNLANFMHSIENKSRRMRVTYVRLDREGNLDPWEYGNDRWKWELKVTSRQKEGAE